jgi:hypothetical protein
VGDDEGRTFVFETAVTVTVMAVGGGKGMAAGGMSVYGLDGMDKILHLGAVSPDILHGGGTDLPGDEGEVFRPPPSLLKDEVHDIIPKDSGADT